MTLRLSLAFATLLVLTDVLGTRVSLNISCTSSAASPTTTNDCLLHSESGFAFAGDLIEANLGSQLEVVHLRQTNLTAGTFDAPRWCIGSKSHLTKSGNFVLVFAQPGAGECNDSTADLDVGDCFSSTHHDGAENGEIETLTVCFNGRVNSTEQATAAIITTELVGVSYPTAGTNSLQAGGGGKCTYEYSSHGSSAVVTSATCEITKADLETGNEPGQTTRKYARSLGAPCPNDDAGHILADRLGGKGTEPTNIMPQAPHLNRGAWEAFERTVAACMNGKASKATLSWTWTYSSSSSKRPTGMTYAASYDTGCDSAHQSFDNTCTPTR